MSGTSEVKWYDTPFSSHISGYAYSEKDQQLFIEFKKTHIYRYERVTKAVFQGLQQAQSKGKFFHQAIRNEFVCVKLNEREHVERNDIKNCQLDLFRSDSWR